MTDLSYLAGKLLGIASMVEIGAADNEQVAKALAGIAEELVQEDDD
jgi:hypothetical protein